VPSEGEILDSVTLVMENTNSGVAAVLFTADASGFTWLPDTPGLLSLPTESIESVPTGFVNMQPLPANRLAYQVALAVPKVLATGWVNLTLVLYDYPNGLNSAGWVGPATVIPPSGQLQVTPTADGLFRTVGPSGGNFVPISQAYTDLEMSVRAEPTSPATRRRRAAMTDTYRGFENQRFCDV
jgi:hypothetical protein